MRVLDTKVDRRSDLFAANREGMLERIAVMEEQQALAIAGGGQRYVERHRERGKL
ncbi:MAG: acyl-CoA carboxylase subunit beta, partial [Actinomycetota bacterium]